MKLLIKQKVFALSDTYDVYDENGDTKYFVKAKMFSFGHTIHIYDTNHDEVGIVRQKMFSFMPKFNLILNGEVVGALKKHFSLKPYYTLDYNQWEVKGNFLAWEYDVVKDDSTIMHISKEPFRFGDTYALNITNKEDEVLCLLIAIAIDAANRRRD